MKFTHLINNVEPFGHCEDEEDVVLGQLLPQQGQGRIVLDGGMERTIMAMNLSCVKDCVCVLLRHPTKTIFWEVIGTGTVSHVKHLLPSTSCFY